jgi:hypothetical protein
MGTRESTAAPPLVITLTIFSYDFVFLTPLVASFLSAPTGALLFGSLDAEASFLGLGSFLGEGTFLFELFLSTLATLCLVSLAGVADLTDALLFVALMGAGGSALAGVLGLEVDLGSVSAFLASTLACLALSLAGIKDMIVYSVIYLAKLDIF